MIPPGRANGDPDQPVGPDDQQFIPPPPKPPWAADATPTAPQSPSAAEAARTAPDSPWAANLPTAPESPPPSLARAAAAPPEPFEPWRLAKPVRRGPLIPRRLWLGGIAGLALLGLAAAAAVVLMRGEESEPARGRLAGAVFAHDPQARGDGRDQRLFAVAASGSTVVAAGTEDDGLAARTQFLVSADGGRSFRLGKVQAADGGEPGPDEAPRFVAGGPRGWVALGDGPAGPLVWTSSDGQVWRRQPDDAAGSLSGPGTQVHQVVSTSSGFLAIGAASRKGDFTDATPVLWLSADGLRWEQRSGAQLKLGDLGKGSMPLTDAAAAGNTAVILGLYDADPAAAKVPPSRRVWSSADGGRTWRESKVPAPPGTAGLTISGGADGFLAVREISKGRDSYGQAFTSADGQKWTEAGRLKTDGYRRIRRLLGGGAGFVAALHGKSGAVLLRSADGKSWQHAGTVPMDGTHRVAEIAATSAATIVVGHDLSGADPDAVLAVRDPAGGELPADPAKIAGAVNPDLSISALGTVGGRTVAAGSSDGNAAIWSSPDGESWRRARADGEALSATGRQRLTGLTHGPKGWLAVGLSRRQRQPLLAASADGDAWRALDVNTALKPGRRTDLMTLATAGATKGYVVVGADGPSAATWFSADLESWKPGEGDLKGSPKAPQRMRAVVAGAFGFVAAGDRVDPKAAAGSRSGPAVWTSADGLSWKARQLPLPGGTEEGSLTHLVAKGRTLVALGEGRRREGRAPIAYLSADGGASWQETGLPVPPSAGQAVITAATETPSGFTVAAALGRPGAADVALWRSPDGRAWTGETLKGTALAGPGDQRITGLTIVGRLLVGAGRTADHRGDQPTLWQRRLD